MKIREDTVVRNKAVYLALSLMPDGTWNILWRVNLDERLSP